MIYIKAKTKTNIESTEIKNYIGEQISLKGMVYKLRKMQSFSFLILSVRHQYIQCVIDNSILNAKTIVENASISIIGNVVAESRSKAGYEIKIEHTKILSLPKEEPPFSINNREILTSFDSLLNYRPLTLRNKEQKAIFKLQEGLCKGFREFVNLNNFTEIHSPKIVRAGAEGGANIFELDYFGKKAFLAQSPQFYKQMMVGVYERVYEIAPVFRAEKHDTSRHLNEYTSIDIEMGFIDDHKDIMRLETAMLQHVMSFIKTECPEEISKLNVEIPETNDIPCISFKHAKDILKKKLKFNIKDYNDFEPKEEELISEYIKQETGSDFVFIEGYPSSKRPFYTMDSEEHGYTNSFDLLFRGMEVTTGGQRIHDFDMQVAKMEQLDLDISGFESYLMAHKYGLPPHGGFGLGLERLTMKLLNYSNVRYTCMFPRDIKRLTP